VILSVSGGGAGGSRASARAPRLARAHGRSRLHSQSRTRGRARAHDLSRPRGQQGVVTAEAATVLPVLVALTAALVWLVSLATTQVRVVDAARETARALARHESREIAVGLGERIAPAGSQFTVRQGDRLVRVHVEAEVTGPGGLFDFLPAVGVDAEAVAAQEPT
jgi:hypothetical protein